MVFLDSNLFIIDRFFRRDALYPATRSFLARLGEINGTVPLFTLLELCGAASFRLGEAESQRWLHNFATVYPVKVLDPFGLANLGAAAWLVSWAGDLTRYLAQRMTFGDAALAREADRYSAEAIVTWNVKDFEGRTAIRVTTPERFFVISS